MIFFFFKQKTAYEMRISDWSSDVCSSDLVIAAGKVLPGKASTVKLARWPSLICPTSASSTETSSFILERSSAITNKVGVLNDAATVWPGSTCRASTTTVTEIGRESGRERVCQYV